MPDRPLIIEYEHTATEFFLNQIQAVKCTQHIGFPGIVAILDGIA